MSEWFSIEVLSGASSARAWADAFGDAIVQAGLGEGAIDWEWHHEHWGSLLEIEFPDEADFERFRALPIIETAFDAVPDSLNGLLIHRGRGGASGTRRPRRPLPVVGSGAIEIPLPLDDFDAWFACEPIWWREPVADRLRQLV